MSLGVKGSYHKFKYSQQLIFLWPITRRLHICYLYTAAGSWYYIIFGSLGNSIPGSPQSLGLDRFVSGSFLLVLVECPWPYIAGILRFHQCFSLSGKFVPHLPEKILFQVKIHGFCRNKSRSSLPPSGSTQHYYQVTIVQIIIILQPGKICN